MKPFLYMHHIKIFFLPFLERRFGRSRETKNTEKPLAERKAMVESGLVGRSQIKLSVHLDTRRPPSKTAQIPQSFGLRRSGCEIWAGPG